MIDEGTIDNPKKNLPFGQVTRKLSSLRACGKENSNARTEMTKESSSSQAVIVFDQEQNKTQYLVFQSNKQKVQGYQKGYKQKVQGFQNNNQQKVQGNQRNWLGNYSDD